MFTIRQERQSDYDEVYALVQQAFATASHSDGTEADYLHAVRAKDTFIPALSFVVERKDTMLVAQIVLYRAFIETQEGSVETLVLSPLSVHPNYFRQGIARMLIEHALAQAAAMGYTSVFLCGDPAIYRNIGFLPSYAFQIFHRNDPAAPWCMARELAAGSLAGISGTIDIV